jgi:hypothetical protein
MHCFNVRKLSFNRKLSDSHKHRPQIWRFWWQWTFELDELYIAENSNSFCYITLLHFSGSHTRFPLRPRFTEVCYWFSFRTNILKFIWNSTTNVDYGRTVDPNFSDHTTIVNLEQPSLKLRIFICWPGHSPLFHDNSRVLCWNVHDYIQDLLESKSPPVNTYGKHWPRSLSFIKLSNRLIEE